jgi:hypothetical protein
MTVKKKRELFPGMPPAVLKFGECFPQNFICRLGSGSLTWFPFDCMEASENAIFFFFKKKPFPSQIDVLLIKIKKKKINFFHFSHHKLTLIEPKGIELIFSFKKKIQLKHRAL